MVLSFSADVTCAMHGQPKQFSTQAFVHILFLKSEGKPRVLCGCLLRYLNKVALALATLRKCLKLFTTHGPPVLGLIASFTSPSRKNPHNARILNIRERSGFHVLPRVPPV